MNIHLFDAPVATSGFIAGYVPLVVAIQAGAGDWTPMAVGTAIGGVLASGTIAVVTVINALAQAEDRRQAKDAREKAEAAALMAEATAQASKEAAALAASKADTIIEKTAEIHTAANSTLARATAALELARMEFKGLQASTSREIEGLKQQIVLLIEARTAAVAATTPATVPPEKTP